jgi:hypothetical protein
VSHLREEHIEDGWWTMPGEPVPALSWPGTKNGQTHRIWLPKPAQELLPAFNARTGVVKHLDAVMRKICGELGWSGRPRTTCVELTAPPSPL